jgi:hypothetical protein
VNFQIQLSKSLQTLPLQRDYMFKTEKRLLGAKEVWPPA